jgi:phosphoenolpyruvate mutase
MDSRVQTLRNLLTGPRLSFLMEAHHGLSAKVVEKTGFEGIWASGLSISASMGLRDANEASWTQVLEVMEFMSDATSLPILADCDSGYGNFNNVRRLIKKLCRIGIAGACIEDKIFPKANSFVTSQNILVDVDEFCGKIKAAKDAQTDPTFNLVARVEALIAGRSVQEALDRAVNYFHAGADAILIHSKKNTAEQILEFAKQCPPQIPLVIIPTSYYNTPTKQFEEVGIKTIIWANYNLRASIKAMEKVSEIIKRERDLLKAEEMVSPLEEVFLLTNEKELDLAKKRYNDQS